MHRIFLRLSTLMAIAGGIVLSILVALIVFSILGRELNALLHNSFFQTNMKGFADWLLGIELPGFWGAIKLGPVNGDYELVEAGIAFSIFAFLPLAQISGSHATVDIFTSALPDKVQHLLGAVIEVIFAVVLILIAVQLYHGTVDKMDRHQTTFLLQFPLWWAYAVSLIGAVAAAVVSVYLALMRLVETVTGRRIVPAGEGADH
ncbi:MAG: TRAP transporter small permease [Maritimibacter sp.]|nr:TRAP transporter small permease [Maritimibacter sp.]